MKGITPLWFCIVMILSGCAAVVGIGLGYTIMRLIFLFNGVDI